MRNFKEKMGAEIKSKTAWSKSGSVVIGNHQLSGFRF